MGRLAPPGHSVNGERLPRRHVGRGVLESLSAVTRSPPLSWLSCRPGPVTKAAGTPLHSRPNSGAQEMIESYERHVSERAAQGLPPLPLNAQQTEELCGLLKSPPAGQEQLLLNLFESRVPPGVDPAAKVKAAFLAQILENEASSPLISKTRAVEILGTI